MNDAISHDALVSLIVALIASPLSVLTGAKGIDGFRWLAKKFLEVTDKYY